MNKKSNQKSDPPSTGEDLQLDDLPEQAESAETQDSADEKAMVAGVEAVGRIAVFISHIKRRFWKMWNNPKQRKIFLGSITLVVLLLAIWPTSRYGTLNSVGLRGSARITIIDQATNLPVSNVEVSIGGSQSTTNDEGVAVLGDVRLGNQNLYIDKVAYAETSYPVRIGLGSNRLEDVELIPIGTQFVFSIQDWLSDEPLSNARVSYMESSAPTDADGLATLVIPPTDQEQITVTITGDGYHAVEAKIGTTSNAINEVQMVNGPKQFYISRRSGNYDLYSSRLDGKDEELLVAGTGSETRNIRLSISPNNQRAALVSTRNGIRDSSGRLQNSLHIINLEDLGIEQIDQSQDLQLVDWIGTQLIYVRIDDGESAFSPRRHQIVSYDTASGDSTELEASNSFNDVKVLRGSIYYAADDSFKQENPKPYLYKMDANGQNKQALIERQSWTIFQSSFDEIVVNTTKNGWFRVNLETNEQNELDGQPSVLEDQRYVSDPTNEKHAWIDERDGKGVVLVYNSQTKKEQVVYQAGGVQAPLRWINSDKLIFRVANDQETADYIVDIDGGEPQKIMDVAGVEAATRWFYY